MVSLIVLRYPNFVFKPRFWAEEAVYFEIFYSLDHWWQSFNLLIYPAYYLFLSRLGPSLATVFPIEYAPLVTSFVGLIVLSIPLLIIFYTDSIYWSTIKSKLLISSLYIFYWDSCKLYTDATGSKDTNANYECNVQVSAVSEDLDFDLCPTLTWENVDYTSGKLPMNIENWPNFNVRPQ